MDKYFYKHLKILRAIYERPYIYGMDKSLSALMGYISGIDCENVIQHLLNEQKRFFDTFQLRKFDQWFKNIHKDIHTNDIMDYILENLAKNNQEVAWDIFFDEYIKFLKEVYNIDFLSISASLEE